jgi:epoxyqueuosine reductase QueG
MKTHNISLWGAADLREFSTPTDATGQKFPMGISWAIPMHPQIMFSIQQGPTRAYADEYARVNNQINKLAAMLVVEIRSRGFRAQALAASDRTDPVNIRGDFPHKTVATRAGLGWIGHHCQLITRKFGSWIRLGTVFTDMELPYGLPVERSFCGRCMQCVEACPAGALRGNPWYPGLPREEILDATICDRWKKENYFEFHAPMG